MNCGNLKNILIEWMSPFFMRYTPHYFPTTSKGKGNKIPAGNGYLARVREKNSASLLGHASVTTTEKHYAPLLATDVEEFVL